MKKFKQVIIHLFLFGMMLSVLQYLPIFEEEPAAHGTELVKKAKEDTSGSDDDTDDDSDDLKTDLYSGAIYYYTLQLHSKSSFSRDMALYKSRTIHVTTPPPEA